MVEVNKIIEDKKGIIMIEKMLVKYSNQLPEEKTINDFGGGYVEILKTKAKVVLYFGFTSANNRVQIKFEIAKGDVLKWENAIAQKLWNVEDKNPAIETFDDDIDEQPEEEVSPFGD